jgi:hypothetical protein
MAISTLGAAAWRAATAAVGGDTDSALSSFCARSTDGATLSFSAKVVAPPRAASGPADEADADEEDGASAPGPSPSPSSSIWPASTAPAWPSALSSIAVADEEDDEDDEEEEEEDEDEAAVKLGRACAKAAPARSGAAGAARL